MGRELARDALLYLLAVLVLGTIANLPAERHLAWWGRGTQPPREGVDFTFIDPASAETLRLSLPDAVLIDTRTAAEYAGGHIPGAIALDYTDLDTTLTGELFARIQGADAVILYGASGETDIEQLTAQELRRRGLAPPLVLLGGYPAWEAGGLPVVEGKGAP